MSEHIEMLLKQMPLKAAPASLDARVLALRPAAPAGAAVPLRRYRRMLALGFAGGALAAAAALVLAWGLWTPGPAVSAPPTEGAPALAGAGTNAADLGTKPLRLERNWSQVSYDGLVFPDARTPWRQFRQRQIEHVRWTDPQQGIEVESTVPHENILLVKAPIY